MTIGTSLVSMRKSGTDSVSAVHGLPTAAAGDTALDRPGRNSTDSLVDTAHRQALNMIGNGARQAVDVVGIVRSLEPLAASHVVDEVVAQVSALIDGLGPIEPLLSDPLIGEVMVNGPGRVWIERNGATCRSGIVLDRAAVDLLIERIVAPLGRRVDQRTPCVDGRLPDGSRVHVAVPPIAVDGPYVTIPSIRASNGRP